MSLIGEPAATSTGHALGRLLQCDVLVRAAESGKGRARPESMKFTVARDHARVAAAVRRDAPAAAPSY
jgi:hypothetical protein